MKNEEEIRELLSSKLEQMKTINVHSVYFIYLDAEIKMLKWVLEGNNENNI